MSQADLFIERDAAISDCGRYRWTLSRNWDPTMSSPWLGWIMLNPSTADATTDDPTIRKCMGFARRWGYGGISVTNLFALRATNPADMLAAADPVGPNFDHILIDQFTVCPVVIAAWGLDGGHRGRDRQVYDMLHRHGRRLMCLGLTKDGHPRHPLYVHSGMKPIPFTMPGVAGGGA